MGRSMMRVMSCFPGKVFLASNHEKGIPAIAHKRVAAKEIPSVLVILSLTSASPAVKKRFCMLVFKNILSKGPMISKSKSPPRRIPAI